MGEIYAFYGSWFEAIAVLFKRILFEVPFLRIIYLLLFSLEGIFF
jgi:hypothetical protein